MIKILGHQYELLYNKTLARDSSSMGRSCANACQINIDPTLPETMVEEVLIHEILEQIDYMFQLGLEHNVIQSLGFVLHQVIKDNPDVFSMAMPKADQP